MGLQEKIVIDDLYSETVIPTLYLARRKWAKREKAERTRPNSPTHFNFDLKSSGFASAAAETAPPSLVGETHFMGGGGSRRTRAAGA